jgi:hypothetical protein
MKHTTRNDALRGISAIGAGVLLAATPHCGGKSEGTANDANGGTQNDRGGASGSAGDYTGGYAGFVGVTGGYGGSYGGYGGSYGGAVGTGGTVGLGGTAGTCPLDGITRCWDPTELQGCAGSPDAGPDVIVNDGGPETGIGEGGAAGAPAEAQPEPDSRIYIREAAVPQPPNGFVCPTSPAFPQCIMSTDPPPPPIPYVTYGWNGTECCYTFYSCS